MRMKEEWYLLATKSRFEKRSNLLLIRDGIETYLPLTRELKQWSDRKKWVEKPLFPGYLFARFSQKDRFKILNTEGVACVIKFENTDYVISEDLIDSIKEYIANEPNPILINTLGLTIGEEITIKDGPFAGINGVLTQIKGKVKVLITIDIIGQAFVIELKGNDIEKKQISG